MTTAAENITKFKQFDQYDFDKDSQFQVYTYTLHACYALLTE